jgi:L-alanine-DL-glutamate epimerase-like enolase superfamily enzyme
LDADSNPSTAPIADVRATRLVAGLDADDLDGSSHTVLIEVDDANGLTGIGEADSSSAAVHAVVTMQDEQRWNWGLRSVLLGADPVQIGALWDKLAEVTAYQGPSGISRHALAAVDIALHDLAGKQLRRPGYHLLGGARRSHLTPYATIYAGAIRDRSLNQMMEATLGLMDKAVRLGFRAVKMEVVFEHLATDRDLVSCIRHGRAVVGDDVELLVDFGYRWTDWRDACWTLRHAEDSRIWLAEATLPHGDLESHARLAERVETRVGGGEFATTFEECRAWLEVGHVDVVQADISRCGGLTEMRRVAQAAAMHGAAVIPHCWKTGINAAAARHFQAATANAPFIEMLSPELFHSPLRAGLVSPEPVVRDGRLPLPTEPGIGVQLSDAVVEQYRQRASADRSRPEAAEIAGAGDRR